MIAIDYPDWDLMDDPHIVSMIEVGVQFRLKVEHKAVFVDVENLSRKTCP